MFDLTVKRTQDSLIKTINDSQLPISVIVYMLQSLLTSAKATEKEEIAKQEEQERNQ